MEEHERNFIWHNITALVNNTFFHPTCITVPLENEVFGEDDVAFLESEPNEQFKVLKFYRSFIRKANSFHHLIATLEKGCQTGAVKILKRLYSPDGTDENMPIGCTTGSILQKSLPRESKRSTQVKSKNITIKPYQGIQDHGAKPHRESMETERASEYSQTFSRNDIHSSSQHSKAKTEKPAASMQQGKIQIRREKCCRTSDFKTTRKACFTETNFKIDNRRKNSNSVLTESVSETFTNQITRNLSQANGEVNIKAPGQFESIDHKLLEKNTSTSEKTIKPHLGKLNVDFPMCLTQSNMNDSIPNTAIGIDLGTTTCCVAVCRGQKMETIKSPEGDRTTPSFVRFQYDGNHVVGNTAKVDAYRNATDTIFAVKRILGQPMDNERLQNDKMYWPFNVVEHNGHLTIEILKQPQTVEYVIAVILRSLKLQAERELGVTVNKAVITVPAYFDAAQRAAILHAGKLAGFEVLATLNEPTAAAIASTVDNMSDQPRKVLVYDLGGGNFGVTVLRIQRKSILVLGENDDTKLGGEDFGRNLMEECVRQFLKETGINLLQNKYSNDESKTKRILYRLHKYCEIAKRDLTAASQATISIPGILEDKDLYVVITRERFEQINKPLFQRTIAIVNKALADANVRKEEIDEILMVGGSTRIPKIKELVSQNFNGKRIPQSIDPDTAVAHGAAIQAMLLNGGHRRESVFKNLNLRSEE